MSTARLAAVAISMLLAGCEKTRLDAEVRRLCEQDGGIKVYETVALPADKFNKFGSLYIPSKKLAKPEDDYYYEWDITQIEKGNPSMSKDHFSVVRKKDGKILGEAASYIRSGGDPPGPWHESSFRCPDIDSYNNLIKQIFAQDKKGDRP